MLTETEKALAGDAAVMLAKNKIIQEVYHLFGSLVEAGQPQTVSLPAEIVHLHPKISKGENNLGLPWVMLDYPRFFSGSDTFAIRTMFWWGHYFSLHLLLRGKYMQLLVPQVLADGWYFSTAATPWQHQYEAENTLATGVVTADDLQKQASNGFYKLSVYLSLQYWDEAERFLNEKFEEALRMVVGCSR